MLKFSFGLPKRSIKRLNTAPQVADMQEILTQAMEENDKDIGISWGQGDHEFKIVVRHRASQLLWRLLSGTGLASQVIWSSNDTNVRTVFAQVIARCNDLSLADDDVQEALSRKVNRNDELSTSTVRKALERVDGGTKDPASKVNSVNRNISGKLGSGQPADAGARAQGPSAMQEWHREGALNCIRMSFLLNSLVDATASGRLTILAPDDIGEVYFHRGQLVHATTTCSVGEDSILEVLCWESGRYQFEQNLQPEQQTIQCSMEDLMLRDMQLLVQANELEQRGLAPSSFVSRQRDRLGEGVLDELMQKSMALKRVFLAVSQPLTVAELIERVQLPRSQFVPALRTLLQSGLLMFWNEEQPESLSSAGGGGSQSIAMERFSFQQRVKAKPDAQDEIWLQSLATPGGAAHLSNELRIPEPQQSEVHPETRQLATVAFDFVNAYGLLFNRFIVDPELTVTMSETCDVGENGPPAQVPGQSKGQSPGPPLRYARWRASTTLWSLSCRARGDCIELFLVPARECVLLGEAEYDFRRRLKLERLVTPQGSFWVADALPVSPSELRLFLRTCFRDLVRTTIADLQFEETGEFDVRHIDRPEAMSQSTVYATQHMKQIIFEKQNLAQKIVSQQEEIQRRIARDLHDAVIADVTMLKRSLDGEARLNRADTVKALEAISHRLREICYDLSPSDLRDWGLPTTIEALLDHLSQRTGAECELVCNDEIPTLEGPVELHIFRIIQEALNNSAKYSGASYVSVTSDIEEGWLVFRVEDNGKGFDQDGSQPKASKEGGTGMGSMLERTQLIQCFYPAKLETRSQKGRGTITRLAIKLPANLSNSRQSPAGKK